MPTQLTFTNDITDISTAQNADGSIRWHVYSRQIGNSSKIYVRRETPPNTFEAEVLFLQEGEKPRVFFDPSLNQWLVVYRLNENMWWVRTDENDAPTTQTAQTTNLLVSGFGAAVGETPGPEIVAEKQEALFAQNPQGPYAFNAPRPVATIGIGPSPTPGMFEVRWRATPTSDANGNAQWAYGEFPRHFIAGFNVYRINLADGSLVKLNPSPVPFEGFDPKLYVYPTPAVAGTYFVVQVNFRGPHSTGTVEGRIVGAPRDLVRSDGTALPDIVEAAFPSHIGDISEVSRFVVTDRTPLLVLQLDFFPSHIGEGFEGDITVLDFAEVQIADFGETFPSHIGEGFFSRITQTGTGSVLVG